METHDYVVNSYRKPTFCLHCRKLLLGLVRQGLQCQHCKINLHKSCAVEYKDTCPINIQKATKENGSAKEAARGSGVGVNSLKILYMHGLESGPGGNKHRWLIKNYGSQNVYCKDFEMSLWRLDKKNGISRSVIGAVSSGLSGMSMTEISANSVQRSLQGCLDTQEELFAEARNWSRKILVGSSWGGAIATLSIALGFWEGPAVLIAPAYQLIASYSAKHDVDEIYQMINNKLTIEQKQCCVIIHGTDDNVVNFEFSENMSQKTGIPLVSIPGGTHALNEELMETDLLKQVINDIDKKSKGIYSVESKDDDHMVVVKSIKLLNDCITFIQEHLNEEGLFRIPGSQGIVDEVKSKYSKDDSTNHLSSVKDFTVFEACSLLKDWIKCLDKPLIPNSIYYRINTQIQEADEVTLVLAELQKLVDGLPATNKEILARVINLMKEVDKNNAVNRMTAKNLGVCLSPCLLPPPEGVSGMDLVKNINSSATYIECLIDSRLTIS